MWVFGNDFFLSIVSKDCRPDELLVRARRPGDVQKIFPRARVRRVEGSDYLYRTVVSRAEVEAAVAAELRRITYPNFKDSVTDDALHDAYLRVWSEMAKLQPTRPYSGKPAAYKDSAAARRSEIARNAANKRWNDV